MKRIIGVLSKTTLSNLFFGLYQWILLIILIRWGTVEEAGYYTYSLAITAPLIMLLSLKYENILQTQELEKADIYSLFVIRVYLLVISSLITIPIFIIYNDEFFFILVLSFVWIYKCVQLVIQFKYSLLIHFNEIEFLNNNKIRRSIISILITLAIYGFTRNLLLLLFILSIYMVFEWYVIARYLKKYNFDFSLIFRRKSFSLIKTNFKRYIILFIPFGLSLALISLNANISRFYGEKYFGIEFVGFYASLIYFVALGNIVINAIFSIVSFRFRKNLNQNFQIFKRDYRIVNFFILFIGGLGVITAFILGENVLVFIYGAEYEDLEIEFFLIMIIGMFLYSTTYYQYVLTMFNKLNVQFYITFVGLLTQILLIFTLQKIGEFSIYISYASSLALMAFISYLVLRNEIKKFEKSIIHTKE